ncbi:hypothetical protein NQ176_g9146 [Zarea fungicola]|uniref:Uncharacterized protein n=1 Tax=Zarea fungicola TaxID=93591 RepID=A0ACC1MQ98_9HYPO|nr:hypothetical protein NQ176_g9146 [Lecanicillium fungicola]
MSSRASRPLQKVGRNFKDLPVWYHRLLAITIKEDRDIEPDDFDKDISDLEETSETTETSDGSVPAICECDRDSDDCDCECESSGHDGEDHSSQRSYDGSDADYYYELKYEREERKRELQEIRLEQLKVRDFEQQKVTEVEEAVRQWQDTCALRDAFPPLTQLTGKLFYLFCVDYVDHCWNADLSSSKYVEFHALDADAVLPDEEQPSHDNSEQIYGHVYLDANTGCDLAPFIPPKLAGVEEHSLKSFHGEYELLVRFISNDYLILTVPQRLILQDQSPLQSAPDTFQFMGIRFDREKERKERLVKRKRSPSPRESWFEMNHPMGAWNLGGL